MQLFLKKFNIAIQPWQIWTCNTLTPPILLHEDHAILSTNLPLSRNLGDVQFVLLQFQQRYQHLNNVHYLTRTRIFKGERWPNIQLLK